MTKLFKEQSVVSPGSAKQSALSVSNEAASNTTKEVPDKGQMPEGRKAKCKCRKDTRWSARALECQLYIDVDCSNMTYSSQVSPVVQAAAESIEHQLRGWSTEEDKREKVVNLERVKNQWGIVYSKEELYKKYEAGICWFLMMDFSETCSDEDYVTQLAPKNLEKEIPSNRSQTPSEAIEQSLLTSLASNNTTITEQELDEAFCRDTEAFSEALQVDDTQHRPPDCQPLDSHSCAVLYDSSDCLEGTWQLPVLPATQKRLRFWSSDYKYRNDADVVAVRNGCTFTGWTGSGFTGDSFKLTAGTTDRWVVFQESQMFQRFDESILSFQCNCRD